MGTANPIDNKLYRKIQNPRQTRATDFEGISQLCSPIQTKAYLEEQCKNRDYNKQRYFPSPYSTKTIEHLRIEKQIQI